MEGKSHGFKVTVFGGSKTVSGEKAYEDAKKLGHYLGESGWIVLTGGYIGTMEAVSRGAAEAGGHVIGVTCDEIEAWRPVAPNPWVMEEIRYSTLRERMYALIDNCDTAVVLPGGIGTLAEVAVMWAQLQVKAIKKRSMILVGDGWEKTVKAMFNAFNGYISDDDRRYIRFAQDVDTAYTLLREINSISDF